ncbi:MAG: glycosyltransferase [Candidatus Kuenenia stuttgartiensis]|nr:glycosyltransferase [Candidatus Kuenenia stuttgartiensis]
MADKKNNTVPLVSVVMPVYNAAAFLKPALDSVLSQTYNDFEFIIVNDGSTDKSEEIILSYDDRRIKYHKRTNKGVAATLNEGLTLATGKYIMRHDADDISLPTRLEEQVALLEQNPEIALCSYQVAFMTERGKVARDFKQPHDAFFGSDYAVRVRREQFNPYCPITHGTVLVRKEIMKELGGYRKEFITGEDIDMWLRLIQKYHAVVLHKVLSYHRLSSNSATQVHGWKNIFFRNLAFEYFEQRELTGIDDLQARKRIDVPQINPYMDSDDQDVDMAILYYHYPLAVNARDYRQALAYIQQHLGNITSYKVAKAIILPWLGTRIVKEAVTLKRQMRKVLGRISKK